MLLGTALEMIRDRKKNIALYIVGVLAVGLAAMAAYRAASPKVVVSNRSVSKVDWVVLKLPDNRVSFSAIEPNESATIYFDLQENDGVMSYEVAVGEVVHRASGEYVVTGQLGRTISIEIDSKGRVTFRSEG